MANSKSEIEQMAEESLLGFACVARSRPKRCMHQDSTVILALAGTLERDETSKRPHQLPCFAWRRLLSSA